jgi:hypothetical protein
MKRMACSGALVLGVIIANSAGAQEMQRIVVTPYAGIFVPSSSIAEAPLDIGGRPGVAGIEQQPGLATGITASFSFNNFAGVELSGAWAFSDVKMSPMLAAQIPGFAERHESARVLMGAAKLMINLLPINRRAALRLGVGPAVISRGGSAFKADDRGDFDGVTDVGGAISLCTRLPLSDFLAVRIRAENFMYASRLRYRDFSESSPSFTFNSNLQNDLIFSAGLQMVWWR